jgi:hypothetical protein
VFALRTLRELKLLRFFAENQVSENLITVVDIIKPPSFDSFQEVCSPLTIIERKSDVLMSSSRTPPRPEGLSRPGVDGDRLAQGHPHPNAF